MTCLVLNFQIPPKFELMLLSFVLLCCHARDQNRIDVQDRTSMFHVGVHSLHSLIDSTSHFSRFCGNGIAMRQTQYCTAIHDTSSMIHPSLYPTNISNSEFQLSSPIVIKLPQSLHRYHGLTMLSTSLQLYCQSLTPLISYHVADVGVCLSRLGGERMCCHLLWRSTHWWFVIGLMVRKLCRFFQIHQTTKLPLIINTINTVLLCHSRRCFYVDSALHYYLCGWWNFELPLAA